MKTSMLSLAEFFQKDRSRRQGGSRGNCTCCAASFGSGDANQAFTKPTFPKFSLLMVAMILTSGRRTVNHALRVIGVLAPGHWSNYHQVFYRRRWSLWTIARLLTVYIVKTWWPEGRIQLVGDETVESHPGKRVYEKGR